MTTDGKDRAALVDGRSRTPSAPDRRPIFLVGAARSGTTLLRFMLASHPRIFIPPQQEFIPRLFRRHSTAPLTRVEAVDALRVIFSSRPFIKDWRDDRPDLEAFVDDLADLTPATLLDTVYRRYAQQFGAQRWGDKSPILTGHVDLLATMFPTAQFVHIVRDGRDVALSLIDTYGSQFHVDIYFAARTWNDRVGKALDAARKLSSERYLEVRYEQLTAEPEAVLRDVCAFLGEDYLPEMTEPHKIARDRLSPTGTHAMVREPVTTDKVARWRREMSPRDLRLFEHVAGERLADLGYERAGMDEMTARERLRLAALRAKYELLTAGRRVLERTGRVHPH